MSFKFAAVDLEGLPPRLRYHSVSGGGDMNRCARQTYLRLPKMGQKELMAAARLKFDGQIW